jgi:hypothetical protein
MNSANTDTMTAGDLIVMGLEVEEDLANGEELEGRASAIHHIRLAVEEMGGVAEVLRLIALAAGGAADVHADEPELAGEVAIAARVHRGLSALADMVQA